MITRDTAKCYKNSQNSLGLLSFEIVGPGYFCCPKNMYKVDLIIKNI